MKNTLVLRAQRSCYNLEFIIKRFSNYVYYKDDSLFSCVILCVFEYVTFDNLLERYLTGYH